MAEEGLHNLSCVGIDRNTGIFVGFDVDRPRGKFACLACHILDCVELLAFQRVILLKVSPFNHPLGIVADLMLTKMR